MEKAMAEYTKATEERVRESYENIFKMRGH